MSDRVLLTGISGFLGGHVALQLLNAGYTVRGSVRSLDKADKVRETLRKAGANVENLEFVALDLSQDAGWTEAMADVHYLQHVASPFVTQMPADKMDLIRPAVEGTTRALNAALAAKVERIVLTSSFAAMGYGHDKSRTKPFTPADWTNLDGRDANAYIESKTRAERAAWDIMDKAGRHDDLVTINPTAILGPLLDDDAGTSAALVGRLLNGSVPAAPRISFTIVDVRDVAEAQVKAMTAPEAGGHRFLIGTDTLSLFAVSNILRPVVSDLAKNLPRFEMPDWFVRLYGLFDADVRGNLGELGVVKSVDPSEAVALLGHPLIAAGPATIATAESLIAHKLV